MSATTKTAAELGVGVGSIFTSSWGYDQTNVDWYQVVDVSKSGKTVKIVRIAACAADDAHVVADPTVAYGECGGCGQYLTVVTNGDDEPVSYTHSGYKDFDRAEKQGDDCYNGNGQARPAVLTKRLQSYSWSGETRVALTMTSYSSAYLWDGKAQYETPVGFGH